MWSHISDDSLTFHYPWFYGAGFLLVAFALAIFASFWFKRLRVREDVGLAKVKASVMLLGSMFLAWGSVYFLKYELSITPDRVSVPNFFLIRSSMEWADAVELRYVHSEDTDWRGLPRVAEHLLLVDAAGHRLKVIVNDFSDSDFHLLAQRFAQYAPADALSMEPEVWTEWIALRPLVEDVSRAQD